jgi:hypothetical protein
LDGLSFEDQLLHLLDLGFLLLSEHVIAQLHAMDFFFHGDQLFLANGGIKSFLHFLLNRNFTFPKEDLALGLYNLSQDVSLLFLELGNLVFESE